jgi:hypothetical protein
MRGRILAVSIGIALAAITGACSSITPNSMIAELGVEYLDSIRTTSWTSCTTQGSCRFNGHGQNEGPACAGSIQGVVWFFDKDAKPIVTGPTSPTSGDQFGWLQNPKPDAVVRAGETFVYISTASIPATVVGAAKMYASQIATAEVLSC